MSQGFFRRGSSRRHFSVVKIRKERFDDLIESEITYLAHTLEQNPMTLRQILEQREPLAFSRFIQSELPIRWAKRIRLIESVPYWTDCPHLKGIRDLYKDCFVRLRQIPATEEEARFTSMLRKEVQIVKKQTLTVLERIITGVRAAKEDGTLSDQGADDFLNEFLTSRIGSDLMTAQFLALTGRQSSGSRSVVDPECDPEAVIHEMVDATSELCTYHYGFAPPVVVETTTIQEGDIRFPFIQQYLYFIISELLKNSLRATAETWDEECVHHPVKVHIFGDDDSIVIRVSDAGGGIPLEDIRKVWSYLYTTAEKQSVSADVVDDDDAVAPMAGFGCGLPLSRSYVNYVGGRLAINTMPHYGTDVYLYLNRLGLEQQASACLDGLEYNLTSAHDALDYNLPSDTPTGRVQRSHDVPLVSSHSSHSTAQSMPRSSVVQIVSAWASSASDLEKDMLSKELGAILGLR